MCKRKKDILYIIKIIHYRVRVMISEFLYFGTEIVFIKIIYLAIYMYMFK
jgi:hypothetical protein